MIFITLSLSCCRCLLSPELDSMYQPTSCLPLVLGVLGTLSPPDKKKVELLAIGEKISKADALLFPWKGSHAWGKERRVRNSLISRVLQAC